MARRWYVVCPEDGLELFHTADGAETRARQVLESWRSEASDTGWIDEIAELEWGEILCHERAVRTHCEPDPSGEFDALEDWELQGETKAGGL